MHAHLPVLTASHSCRSSPNGSRTASSTAPVPSVCSMCCLSVSPLAPTGTFFTERNVPLALQRARQAASGGDGRWQGRRRGGRRNATSRIWTSVRGVRKLPRSTLSVAVAREGQGASEGHHRPYLLNENRLAILLDCRRRWGKLKRLCQSCCYFKMNASGLAKTEEFAKRQAVQHPKRLKL